MQSNLFDVAHARRLDPETSHAAAASVSPERISKQKESILAVLSVYGPLTDNEMIEVFRSAYPHFVVTDQSLRSRRAQLTTEQKVRFAGSYGESPTGKKARKWEVSR